MFAEVSEYGWSPAILTPWMVLFISADLRLPNNFFGNLALNALRVSNELTLDPGNSLRRQLFNSTITQVEVIVLVLEQVPEELPSIFVLLEALPLPSWVRMLSEVYDPLPFHMGFVGLIMSFGLGLLKNEIPVDWVF
jgi:hypothetical protein